jgi:hypothetical protein
MKDFINQNEDIDFDPIVTEPDVEEVDDTTDVTAAENPTQMDVMLQMIQMLSKMNTTMEKMNNKLDDIAYEL